MALSSRTTSRAPRPTIEFTVLETTWLNPHLVRVRLGGPRFVQFQDRPETDKYVKLKFTTPEPESHPVTRTYTVRHVDRAAQAIDVDFVIHGDEGLAGPWAATVEPGATISLMGPGGGYSPDPDADWHLFAGDMSAVPAIAAALEALPVHAVGAAIIEVDTEADILDLDHPTGVDVVWISNPDHAVSALADAVRTIDWREGRVHVFAHGEREAMKELRRVFFDEHALERGQVSLSGYWARGRTEDRFQAEKREPIGQILPPA